MMLVGAYEQDPDATEAYVIDWTDRLEGATISTSTWHLPAGATLAVVDGSPTIAGAGTGCRLSGGTPSIATRVTNRVVFSDGRTLDAEIDVYTR
jgi:hypothetical protein